MASKGAKSIQKYLQITHNRRVLRVRNVISRKFGVKWGINGGNKLSSFRLLSAATVPCVEWTQYLIDAERWIAEGHTVFARTILNGSSGRGIVVCNSVEELPLCQLYTKYKKKKKEFRVHIFNGEVIDVQEKRKRVGNGHSLVRNLDNGYVFCRDNIVIPFDLYSVSLAAVAALGYISGGVDVIWNEREDKCYVLEVNSAPGLEGQTVEKYGNAIWEHYQEQR